MDPLNHPQTSLSCSDRPTSGRDRLRAFLQLVKARLSSLVLLTTAVGFVMASDGRVQWAMLVWTILGTALAAGAANAFNQALECGRDGRMRRTCGRPLPAGAITTRQALVLATLMALAGVTVLASLVNLQAAGLALATILVYVLLYTPLKVRSTLNTLVGAVCGATPPLIGWVAASGTLDSRSCVLAGILFVWQLPHFMALAWLYREDYARGGFRMLPNLDPTGRVTFQLVLIGSLLLLPLGLTATLVGLAGPVHAAGSVVLGLGLVWLSLCLLVRRSDGAARRVFLGSLVYLPLLLCLMLLDRGPIDSLGLSLARIDPLPPPAAALGIDDVRE